MEAGARFPLVVTGADKRFRPGDIGKSGGGLENLSPAQGVSLDRIDDRKGLLRSLDNLNREMDDRNGSLAGTNDVLNVRANLGHSLPALVAPSAPAPAVAATLLRRKSAGDELITLPAAVEG